MPFEAFSNIFWAPQCVRMVSHAQQFPTIQSQLTKKSRRRNVPEGQLGHAAQQMVERAAHDGALSKACNLLLSADLPPTENPEAALHALHPTGDPASLDPPSQLGPFDFTPEQVEKTIKTFSVGQRRAVGSSPIAFKRNAPKQRKAARAGELVRFLQHPRQWPFLVRSNVYFNCVTTRGFQDCGFQEAFGRNTPCRSRRDVWLRFLAIFFHCK